MDISGEPRRTFPPETSSVRAARQFVGAHLEDLGQPDLLWSALQLVSELATNAVLHARSTFSVAVSVLADGAVRIEVGDTGDALPHQRHYGVDATTGRGVAVVAGLARDWGVVKLAEGGKIVWCEIGDRADWESAVNTADEPPGGAAARVARPADGTSTALDGRVVDDAAGHLLARKAAGTATDGLVTARILRLPLKLHARAQQHSEELDREFALIAEQAKQEPGSVPDRLLGLSATMSARYAGFTEEQKALIDAAIEAGDSVLDELTCTLPRRAGGAAEQAGRILDDADELCRQGRLLALATPPEVLAYRQWYLAEFVAQAAGAAPTPWQGSSE
ncbi:MAG: ATP-binding protein [Mycobacteriales bacterium]